MNLQLTGKILLEFDFSSSLLSLEFVHSTLYGHKDSFLLFILS